MLRIAALCTALLMAGCSAASGMSGASSQTAYPDMPWAESTVRELPYEEWVGTLTQYKSFQRGVYELRADTRYSIELSWQEDGELAAELLGPEGDSQPLLLHSGVRLEVIVGRDGPYLLKAPLGGQRMTGVQFRMEEWA